jgi:hypothetical protein
MPRHDGADRPHHSSLITRDLITRDLITRDFVVLAALTVLVALTRFYALSKSIWDWDEGLFCSAMRDYNVVQHHPHPPGFPLFIAAAKLMRLFIHDDFHALRAVSLIAAMLVFPALYALARALGMAFRTSIIAALLFSFLPNVWYWGGTAFSDVFSIVLFLFAAALLFRNERWLYFAGSVLFAATLLVRPQNVLLAYPWFLATWRRLRARRIGDVIASVAVIALLVLAGYGLAARVTGGWRAYLEATEKHQRYVATVDGALNPNRPAARDVWRDFAVDPFEAGRISTALAALALAAFLRPRRRDVDVLLTFAPNFFLAWFMLSVTGVSRLSLGYIPMHALLAADGIEVISEFVARRRERLAAAIAAAITAVMIVGYFRWVRPALHEVRKHDSPPVAAILWVRQHVPRATGRVYVQGGMTPFSEYYLGDYNTEAVPDDFDPTTAPEEPDAVYIADHAFQSPRAINFERRQDHLWALFHRRYFETCAVPVLGGPHWLAGRIEFGSGWYGAEADEKGRPFRWMGARSVMHLEPLGQRGQLSLQFYAPIDAEPPPDITIQYNGAVIERFRVAEANFRRTYDLDSRAGAPGELVISVDHVVNPSHLVQGADPRDLGLRVSEISWKALMPNRG